MNNTMKSWNKLKAYAVSPTSAWALHHEECTRLRRKRPTLGSNGEENDDARERSSHYGAPCCLIQNPFFCLPLGITALAGPAGAGKTQMALSLCVDCVECDSNDTKRSDSNQSKNKAVYVLLGGSGRYLHMISRRLHGMLQARRGFNRLRNKDSNTPDSVDSAESHDDDLQLQIHLEDEDLIHDSLTRIFVRWVCNSEELMEMLQTSLPRLLQAHPTISVVVLDSIASIFRFKDEDSAPSTLSSSLSPSWHQRRAITFFQLSNLCKELSSVFQIPFLVINDATSRIPENPSNYTSFHGTSNKKNSVITKTVLEPALGLAWSQCVNCSFFVQRQPWSSESVTSTAMFSFRHPPTAKEQEQKQQARDPKSSFFSTKQITVCRRLLRCRKAPHITSCHQDHEFFIDQRGAISLQGMHDIVLETRCSSDINRF